MNKATFTCQCCGRPVFGFWKYGEYKVCSKSCLRELIAIGEIPRLEKDRDYPELGILYPKKGEQNG